MISFPFSSLSKRRGATLAGVFSLALSCALLLCGAGSVPVENLLPQGAMQGDLDAGGHNLTNAATVYATAVSATNVVVSGSLTAPASFTLPFAQLTSTPTTLAGYGITDPIVLTSGSYSDPAWITHLAWSKLTGVPGLLSLDSNVTAVGFSYTGGTLSLANVNAANGLVQLNALGNFPTLDGSNLTFAGRTIRSIATDPNITNDGLGDITATSFSGDGTGLVLTGNSSYPLANLTGADVGFLAAGAIAPNAAGGLARLTASDGTADGSIALLGTTDDGASTIAIGDSSNATGGSTAVGRSSSALAGGVAVGYFAATTSTGAAIGLGANATTGAAMGTSATESGGGCAFGSASNATSGFAGGKATSETGGGANFCGGSYAGTGLAINADEVAVPNGSGKAWITGLLAPASANLTAQSGSLASVVAFTPTATGTFRIGGYLTITTLTTDSIQMQVTYTDENGNAQTQNIGSPMATLPGAATLISPVDIRAGTGSAITVIATDTGLGTSIYDVGATIQPLN